MAAITNEASLLNVRGTVAMSLNGTNPDSAERAWFINLTNNTSFDTGTTNGGPYTVFGQILGDGMVVVDKIADVPIYSWNTNFSFSSIPLQDLVASQRTILVRNLIAVKSVATLPFYAISSDPNAFSIKVNGTNLTITFLAYTNKSVTITAYASDTNGNTMKSSFFVQPNPQRAPRPSRSPPSAIRIIPTSHFLSQPPPPAPVCPSPSLSRARSNGMGRNTSSPGKVPSP
jgi:hypothetical protein